MSTNAAQQLDDVQILAAARSVAPAEPTAIAEAIESMGADLQDRSREWAAGRANRDDVIYAPGFVDLQHSVTTTPAGALVVVTYTAELRPTL